MIDGAHRCQSSLDAQLVLPTIPVRAAALLGRIDEGNSLPPGTAHARVSTFEQEKGFGKNIERLRLLVSGRWGLLLYGSCAPLGMRLTAKHLSSHPSKAHAQQLSAAESAALGATMT